jgi:hypothetical protein
MQFRKVIGTAALSALTILPGLLAQTPLEPGWTVSTFVSGLSSPANGLEFDCSTGGFFVGEFGAGRVTEVTSTGVTSFFANVPSVDEIALNRTSTFLFAKQHQPGGPIDMFGGTGVPLGSIATGGFPTGVAFDSAGNFYSADVSSGVVVTYPVSTLPPNTPVASPYASGLNPIEGMRFDCRDNLFVAEFTSGNFVQVVPPSGPHITWASGQSTPLNVAFDPCTNNLFGSNVGDGTIIRVTSPGVFTTFATGLNQPFALVFDATGNLYVNEFGSGNIVKFTTPTPCTSNCLCPTLECPLTQGFWKNHASSWPVTSMTLGSQTYTQAQLLAILGTPLGGDASLILADQLIAANLNVANGSNPAPITSTISAAGALLATFTGLLPYNVAPSSAAGQQMVALAATLDNYNNGLLTPNCTH